MTTWGLPGASGLQTAAGGGGGGGEITEVATIADLYAAKGMLADGRAWKITGTGVAGVIDSATGIDGLRPHPFESTMYPINSTTMELGAIADGKILEAQDASLISLDGDGLHLDFTNQATDEPIARMPCVVHRPSMLQVRYVLTSEVNTNTFKRFFVGWVIEGGATGSETGVYSAATTLSAGTTWTLRAVRQTSGGSPTYTSAGNYTHTVGDTKILELHTMEVENSGQYFWNYGCTVRPDGGNVYTDVLVQANPGFDLSDAAEDFWLHLTGFGNGTTGNYRITVTGIKIAQWEDTT